METTRDLTLSFYDDYGVLSIYAKQFDTQRVIQFEFNEDIIPQDRENFHVVIRGKYSNNTIISPFEINEEDIDDYTVTFRVPSYYLAVPGITTCDLALVINGDEIVFDEQGNIVDDETSILSTHNFNIYVEALPSNGGAFLPYEGKDPVDYITKLIVNLENIDSNAEEYANEAEGYRDETLIYKDEAKEAADNATAIVESISKLTFSVDENGHLIWDFTFSSEDDSDSVLFYESIKDLQNNKVNKSGDIISGDLTINGELTID